MKLVTIETIPGTTKVYKDDTKICSFELTYKGWFANKRVIAKPTGMCTVHKVTDVIAYYCFADEIGNTLPTDTCIRLTNICRTQL